MESNEIIELLNNIKVYNNLSPNETEALDKAAQAVKRQQRNDEEHIDFQGWPIEKLTMRELRKFVKDNCALDDNVKLLVLEDDGMAYGANNGYCSELSVSEDDNGNKEVHIWF